MSKHLGLRSSVKPKSESQNSLFKQARNNKLRGLKETDLAISKFGNITNKTLKAWSSSFSFVKKNFFKFGLEFTLLGLALVSAVINFGASEETKLGENRFLAYLTDHPALNEKIIQDIQTENIHIVSEDNVFIPVAQAATLEPLIDFGTAQLIADSSKKSPTQQLLVSNTDSAIIKPNYATKDALQRKDIQEYVVKSGDSVGKIASDFGVSVMTILHENNLSEYDYIKPGQVLKILPVTGIKHTVKDGETLEQIAKKYEVDVESILEFNAIEIPDDILAGEVLIIPEAKMELTPSRKSRIASYNRVDVKRVSVPQNFAGSTGQFVWPLPTRNITQYYWSRHRALDISNSRRPQFWAAQGGIVELSGWQGAYGRTIVINHGNGLKTRYAHASELYVSAGQRVSKGQVIGRVGNTGRTYGRTGNHLHFEVIKNGVKYNPLLFVK